MVPLWLLTIPGNQWTKIAPWSVARDEGAAVADATATQYAQTFSTLRRRIEDGSLAPGSRLPSERRLAAELDVNRKAVHAALEQLEQLGLVQSVSPRIRAVAHPTPAGTALLHQTLAVLTRCSMPPLNRAREKLAMVELSLLGVVQAIQERGRNSLTISPDRLNDDMVTQLSRQRSDGLVALSHALNNAATRQALERLVAAGVAVAAWSDVLPPAQVDQVVWDAVYSDHRHGAYTLTSWLADHGCRRILRFWNIDDQDRPQYWTCLRDDGFTTACSEHGLTPLPGVQPPAGLFGVVDQRGFDRQVRMISGLLYEYLKADDPIDAVMVASDHQYYYVAAACRILGVDPEREIRIVGYDNVWPVYQERQWEPTMPQATVERDELAIGRQLVELVLDRRRGAPSEPPRTRWVKPSLVVLDNQ